MRGIKGAIFDADGTLFDSMGLWDQAGEIYLRRKGLRPKKDIRLKLENMTMKESADYFRTEYGIDTYFKEILTCTEAGSGKRNPRIYELAAWIIGTKKEETLVLEDAYFAAKTAKNAGFLVAVIRDSYSEKDREKLLEIADIYLENWEDWGRKI